MYAEKKSTNTSKFNQNFKTLKNYKNENSVEFEKKGLTTNTNK